MVNRERAIMFGSGAREPTDFFSLRGALSPSSATARLLPTQQM